MNILRIVYDFPPPWGGLAPGPYELTMAQIALGSQVTVWAGGWPRKEIEISAPGLLVRRLGSRAPYLGIFPVYMPVVAMNYLWEIFENKYQLIHGHNSHPAGTFFFRFKMSNRIPYIQHMHMNAAERSHHFKSGSSWLERWLEWKWSIMAERAGCALADIVICVSESVREQTVKWYSVDPSKVIVIPNGVNTTLFNANGPSVRRELGLEEKHVILYTGRLYSNKNVDKLIEALRYLPDDYHLLVVGTGEDLLFLKAYSENLGVGTRVHFIGFVNYNQLAQYYRASDVFCIASNLEGMPKVVLEALACGVPVVASHSFQPPPDISDKIVWLDQITGEGIAERVRGLVDTGQRTDTKYFQEKYDWKVIASRINQVYRSI